MKNTFKFLLIFVSAIVLFSACQDIVLEGGNIEFDMTIHAESENYKAAFTNGEKLIVIQRTDSEIQKKESSEGKIGSNMYRMNFSVNFDKGSQYVDYEYFVFYPFSAVNGNTGENDLKLSFQLPSVQHPTNASFDPAANILVAQQKFKGQPETLVIDFQNLVSSIKVTFENFKVGNVKKLKITVPYKISGDAAVDLVESQIVGSGSNNYVELDYSSNPVPSERLVAYLTCFPFDMPKGSLVTLDIETTNETLRELVYSEVDFSFEAGELYEIPIVFEGEAPAAISFADIDEPGTYAVNNALVMAVGSSGRYILNDGTANAYVFAPDVTVNIGDVVNVSGEVITYDGVLEWNRPAIIPTGQTSTVTYPSPYNYNETSFESYKNNPVIGYIKTELTISEDGWTAYCGSQSIHLISQNAFVSGTHEVYGYVVGYSPNYSNTSLIVVRSEKTGDPASTFANIDEPGTYTVNNALVMAVGSSGRYVLNDGTANAYVFAPGVTVNVGDVVDLSGNVQLYDGVLEWNSPEVSKTGQTRTVDYPSPYDYDEAAFELYKNEPKIGYIKATVYVWEEGTAAECGGQKIYLAGPDAFTPGMYDVWGYTLGYSSTYSNTVLLVVRSELAADLLLPAKSKDEYLGNWYLNATDFYADDPDNAEFHWAVTLTDGGRDENYEYVTVNHFLPYIEAAMPSNSYNLIYMDGYLYLAPGYVPYTDKFLFEGKEYTLELYCLNHEEKKINSSSIISCGFFKGEVRFENNEGIDGFYVSLPELESALCAYYDIYFTRTTGASSDPVKTVAPRRNNNQPSLRSEFLKPQKRLRLSN